MNLRKHLSYANVVSTVCLFLLLGGVAYAGTKLAKGSVGSEQLKAEAVTKAKLAASSVNSKKVVDGSLTGSDIDAATLGRVPNAANAEHAGTADSANTAKSASTAGTATNADHAVNADKAESATNADHADTATDAETIDGVSPGEFGPMLVASAEAEVTINGEFFFSVSGIHAGNPSLPGLTTILPGRRFRATDFAVRFESSVQASASVYVSLVVDDSAQEVCTLTEVPSTCTPPSTAIEIPAGAQVAWKVESASPVTAHPEFALRLLPG
jgi:hypothetical protein